MKVTLLSECLVTCVRPRRLASQLSTLPPTPGVWNAIGNDAAVAIAADFREAKVLLKRDRDTVTETER